MINASQVLSSVSIIAYPSLVSDRMRSLIFFLLASEINDIYLITGSPHKQCVCLCSKYKEMYGRILKSLNIVNIYRGMFKLKLKINVKVPQLLCIAFLWL